MLQSVKRKPERNNFIICLDIIISFMKYVYFDILKDITFNHCNKHKEEEN